MAGCNKLIVNLNLKTMKKKILILTILFMTITVIKTNATLTIYSNNGQGTTLGSFYCNETYDTVDYGANQYDVYILGGLTVVYTVDLQSGATNNYNCAAFGVSGGMTFFAESDNYPSGQQYYNGNFYWDYDGYLNVAMWAAEYAPSGGVNVSLQWFV
jgi:hypothetical protein